MIVKAIGEDDNFLEAAYRAISPEVLALQSKPINPQELQKVRSIQASILTTWDDPHAGYLDFVTHIREHEYLRLYAGQAGLRKVRLFQHNNAIKKKSGHSLHYWVIQRGGGMRVANLFGFRRLLFR
ncbi:uncharacterized protein N7479_007179 [Penicillium vulpinum]|uniref:Uncharacterized protein n=1 Tax=Penicillium vulpinum TaxID=29845 RepID=A0A1V6S0X0_9EURO|nr:uncharacterized protein N7479_007179 [Penicillium vulpinum]KAJ5960029.1 hypothetical protein N7479_007179 [Penicillium vulpinum]OQE07506.1 hypothetical protein PENVUL_c013G03702 [Penicillium vulpinum]